MQDHSCGLWSQEFYAAQDAKDVQKNVPLICFLQCTNKGMPLTCGFGKLGKSEIQCFAGFDSGFVALWTVRHRPFCQRKTSYNFIHSFFSTKTETLTKIGPTKKHND
jgi:hypothetical protein